MSRNRESKAPKKAAGNRLRWLTDRLSDPIWLGITGFLTAVLLVVALLSLKGPSSQSKTETTASATPSQSASPAESPGPSAAIPSQSPTALANESKTIGMNGSGDFYNGQVSVSLGDWDYS